MVPTSHALPLSPGRSGLSSEECSPATSTFLNLFLCGWLALLPDQPFRRGRFPNAGEAGALTANGEAKASLSPPAAAVKPRARRGWGGGGREAPYPPASGWEPRHYQRSTSFGGGGADKLEAQGGSFGALAYQPTLTRLGICPQTWARGRNPADTEQGCGVKVSSRLRSEPRAPGRAAVC